MVVEFIGTGEQKADIMTKALGRVRFQELRGKIGIVDVKLVRQGSGGDCWLNPASLASLNVSVRC